MWRVILPYFRRVRIVGSTARVFFKLLPYICILRENSNRRIKLTSQSLMEGPGEEHVKPRSLYF
jgi:hypothetical protein